MLGWHFTAGQCRRGTEKINEKAYLGHDGNIAGLWSGSGN